MFGGDEIRARMQILHEVILSPDPPSSRDQLEHACHIILTKLRSVLACHATGMSFVSVYMQSECNDWHNHLQHFVKQTSPCKFHDFREARELFFPYLM